MGRYTEWGRLGDAKLKAKYPLVLYKKKIIERLAMLEDRNEPRKVILGDYDAGCDDYYLHCPVCRSVVGSLNNEDGDGKHKYNIFEKFCCNCGQRIAETYTEEDFKRWQIT